MSKLSYHTKRILPSVIFILLILSSCGNIREPGILRNRSLKKALLWAKQDSIRVADSLNSTLVLNDPAEETFQDSVIFSEEEILSETGNGYRYYIIAGSFANIENAKQIAKEYSNKGYQTSIVSRTDSYGNVLELVSVKTFNNYEEAFIFKNEFRRKVDSSAWLYAIKYVSN